MGDLHVVDFGAPVPNKPTTFASALRAAIKAPEDLFDRWYYRYDQRLDERRARVARANPVCAPLQDELDEVEGLSEEDWETYRRIVYAVVPDGWPIKVHQWLRDHGPEHQYKKAEAIVQRSRRGYADSDTYDLHWYLSGLIAGSVRRLAEITIAYPGPGTDWPEPDDWAAALADLADRFEQLQLKAYDAVDPDNVEVDEAFALLRKLWFHLWD